MCISSTFCLQIRCGKAGKVGEFFFCLESGYPVSFGKENENDFWSAFSPNQPGIKIIIIISIFVKRHKVVTLELLAAVGCAC